ncbi:MAG: ChrR family anti-sigma-E factor [Paracoccaceae bacterium]
MTAIIHHVPDDMLAAYSAGSLAYPYALVVAAHVSLCQECRAGYEAHQAIGGLVLDAARSEALSSDLKARVFALLDAAVVPESAYERLGVFPGPVVEALKGKAPRWRPLGMGIRQCILNSGPEGSVRLLHIPPGQAVPNHSHNGIELTLVLQGSFSDETGRFGVGDLEIADELLEHTPVADPGAPCICLAATDTPIKFKSLMPRLLQPFFQI